MSKFKVGDRVIGKVSRDHATVLITQPDKSVKVKYDDGEINDAHEDDFELINKIFEPDKLDVLHTALRLCGIKTDRQQIDLIAEMVHLVDAEEMQVRLKDVMEVIENNKHKYE